LNGKLRFRKADTRRSEHVEWVEKSGQSGQSGHADFKCRINLFPSEIKLMVSFVNTSLESL